MSYMAPNFKQTSKENKELQGELRELQLKQDAGQSIQPDFSNPCKSEHEAHRRCLDDRKHNSFLNCDDYLQNLKNCEKYWKEVQDYRVKKLNKSGFEYPKEEEFEKWKSRMHNWYITKKLDPPEDI